jgi:hypothetical protein
MNRFPKENATLPFCIYYPHFSRVFLGCNHFSPDRFWIWRIKVSPKILEKKDQKAFSIFLDFPKSLKFQGLGKSSPKSWKKRIKRRFPIFLDFPKSLKSQGLGKSPPKSWKKGSKGVFRFFWTFQNP